MFEYKLKKPVEYNGETYEELNFDFEKLTGRDGLNIEAELKAQGITVMVPAFDSAYLIRLAAKACDKPIGADIFDNMSIADFNKIKSAARSFLLGSE